MDEGEVEGRRGVPDWPPLRAAWASDTALVRVGVLATKSVTVFGNLKLNASRLRLNLAVNGPMPRDLPRGSCCVSTDSNMRLQLSWAVRDKL
jgi:hypothetical protein